MKCGSALAPEQFPILRRLFQRLLELRQDEAAFDLLTTWAQYSKGVQEQLKAIFTSIFLRMQQDADTNRGTGRRIPIAFARGLLWTTAILLNLYGYTYLKNSLDSIQRDIFEMMMGAVVYMLRGMVSPKCRNAVITAYCKLLLDINCIPQELLRAIIHGLIYLIDDRLKLHDLTDEGMDYYAEQEQTVLKTARIDVFLLRCSNRIIASPQPQNTKNWSSSTRWLSSTG